VWGRLTYPNEETEMSAIHDSRELQALIAERSETPEFVGQVADAELYRFSDGTEVIVTNAGLVAEDEEGFAELRAEIVSA
jgi:hypothetical protein